MNDTRFEKFENENWQPQCLPYREGLLDAYLDCELELEKASEVEAHLAQCQDCVKQLDALSSLVDRLKNLPEQVLARDLSDDIMARIQERATPVAPGSPDSSFATEKDNVVSLAERKSAKVSIPRLALIAASIAALIVGASQLNTRQVEVATVESTEHHNLIAENVKKTTPGKTRSTAAVTARKPGGRVSPVEENVVASADFISDYDLTDGVEDYGINTNEDGLYAIKL